MTNYYIIKVLILSFDCSVFNHLDINYGYIIGLVSVLISILFYFKNKRIKKIVYSIKSFVLIDESISLLPGFSALYLGEKLEKVKGDKGFN